MKAAFGKTIGGLSYITRGTYNALTSRFRRPETVERNGASSKEDSQDQELNSVNGGMGGRGLLDRSLTSPQTPPLSRQAPALPQEDDILYSKNNVYLKCKVISTATPDNKQAPPTSNPDDRSPSPAVQMLRSLQAQASSQLSSSHQSSVTTTNSQGEEKKMAGFMFIASRGSNYGSTLILNWAPNSSIIKCSGSINSGIRTAGEASGDLTTSGGSSHEADTHVPHSSSAFSLLDRRSSSSLSSSSSPLAVAVASGKEDQCVSIDLGDMEMVRVFYRADEKGCKVSGEMVVSSRHADFWVFQFENGGLTDLINLFCSWECFNHQEHRESQQHTFTIFRPKLSLSELHSGEGKVKSVLTKEMWDGLFGPEGRITESDCVKKVVFFKGVSPSMRKEVWPFLLGVYKFDSTSREREAARLENCRQYWALDDQRRKIPSSQESEWVMAVQQIDKDVVRTDRSHPYYRGDSDEGRRHVGTLKHILLNYLIHKPDLGYCQGMTDLLAPLLVSMENDVEAFWCFEKLMEGSAYFKPANDPVSVEKQLEPLRMLIRQLLPWFYSYLEETENGLSLMFCHRWLLVCFKREFTEEDTLAIWEACWTNYETTSFHLFVCIAVMAMYGQRAVEKSMNINELMVFFNTLSLAMPRELVLSQARGYLRQFCRSATVHCTLVSLMPPEFWLHSTSPRLECGLCRGMNTSCESRDLEPMVEPC